MDSERNYRALARLCTETRRIMLTFVRQSDCYKHKYDSSCGLEVKKNTDIGTSICSTTTILATWNAVDQLISLEIGMSVQATRRLKLRET